MKQPAIFTLGNNGVVTDPNTRLQYAFAHMFEANHSQSPTNPNFVMSIQYTASVYGNDPQEFAIQLQSQLRGYFGRLFPEEPAQVEVTVDSTESEAKYTLRIALAVVEQGRTYQLNQAVFYNGAETTERLLKAIT